MVALKIGVLSLQGSVIEHMRKLRKIEGVEAVEVRTVEALSTIDGLILPGGESTVIGKLLKIFGLFDPLLARIKKGMPVWGTCAGMILLAKEVVGEEPHLAVMDIRVKRNAFGRQIDSFRTEALIPKVSAEKIPLVFIRAPWIEEAAPEVEVLCSLDGRIVAAQQGQLLVTSFHPELTKDMHFHAYFAAMIGLCEKNVKKIEKRC